VSAAAPVWRAKVFTLLPEVFPGPLGASLAGAALKKAIWTLETVDIRGFAGDKHHTVDDAPFGGGPGMVMRPDVLAAAIDAAGGTVGRLIYLSPRGRLLDQALARELAAEPAVGLVCGRFEGVDERILVGRGIEEISLGDFVLSGGEIAAMALIDTVVRLLPGVIGEPAGLKDESFEAGLLEYPQYTRPQVWEDRAVPKVLLSGHHAEIEAWRRSQAEAVTRTRRPDLWSRFSAKKKGEVRS